MKLRLYLTSLCCLLTLFISGQNVRDWTYNFQNFGLEDGLPSTEVYHVMQDKDLNLWFSTDRGVVRYDGHQFVSYNKSHGLPDLTVFKSYQDESGRVWFSSFSHELSYFENDSIYLFERNKELLEYWKSIDKASTSPHDFFVRNDTVFVGVQRYQMIIIPKEGKVQEFILSGLTSYDNYIVAGNDNQSFGKYYWFNEVWLKSKENNESLRIESESLRKFQKKITYREKTYDIKEEGRTARRINVEYHKESDAVYFSIGSYLYSIKNQKLVSHSSFHQNISDNNITTDIYLDKKEGLWISSVNEGVFYYPSIDKL